MFRVSSIHLVVYAQIRFCVVTSRVCMCVCVQLLYTGMLQTTKIRREGYAVRPSFAEFVEKYASPHSILIDLLYFSYIHLFVHACSA